MSPGQLPRRFWVLVAGLALIGLIARLLMFTGLTLGDDVFYSTQAYAIVAGGMWPPEARHWQTRTGMILPTAASISLLGPTPIAFVLLPLCASTAMIPLVAWVARRHVGDRAALLAAGFAAIFPLDLIYATHLFPDIVVGALSVAGVGCWLRALATDRRGWYAAVGCLAAASYLCRETVVMEIPIYLGIWIWAGRWRRPRLLWAFVPLLLVVAAECAGFAWSTGDPIYRWRAILRQQADPGNLALIDTSVAGGGFWTDPLLMLVATPGFGLYHLGALAAIVFGVGRRPELRPFVIWWVVGYVWLFYGTTVPTAWVTLQRDGRYASSLTAPAVVLVATQVLAVGRPVIRIGLILVFAAAGVFGALLDQGNTILRPHAAFLASPYASTDTLLEPFEYVGARWVGGLAKEPPFGCASDLGNPSLVRVIGLFPVATDTVGKYRYVVFSPTRRPDLTRRFRSDGWELVADFPGVRTESRRMIARLIAHVPSQENRAKRLAAPPGLVVYRNPNQSTP